MNQRTAIFTICSNNYLAQADTFFRSAREHHPDADLFLALADAPAPSLAYPSGVTLLPAEDLGIADFQAIAFRYDIMEFNTAIKPFAFLALFGRGYDAVLYFDPDIMLFRALADVLAVLAGGASFVLTPHLSSPPALGAPRSEVDVMRTGVFNLGFLGASRHPETEPVLRWWARKLRYECVNDQTGGVFVDQKFMDLIPGFTDHAEVLRDTTLNVAYWNVVQRRVGRDGDTWTVDGRPLGFFHFSGFDPDRPDVLSKHAPTAVTDESLRALFALYGRALRRASDGDRIPYAYARFASGIAVPDVVRRMFRDRETAWPDDPFKSYDRYAVWPAAEAVRGTRGEMVTNLMSYVHGRSEQARSRFDLRRSADVAAFVHWFAREAPRLGLADTRWRGERAPA